MVYRSQILTREPIKTGAISVAMGQRSRYPTPTIQRKPEGAVMGWKIERTQWLLKPLVEAPGARASYST